MAKLDIGRILTSGSTKQRLMLIAEDVARDKYGMERLLTDHEYNQLTDSFKKPVEIRQYSEFKAMDGYVGNAILNLQAMMFKILMHYSDLRGYILTWNTMENAEWLGNYFLHNIKDTKERKRVASNGIKQIYFLFSDIETDSEGYLDIQVDRQMNPGEGNLIQVMAKIRKEAEESIVKFISWEKAVLDYMEEKGFNIKTYKEKIKEMGDRVRQPVVDWDKYTGKNSSKGSYSIQEKLLKRYVVCPDVSLMEIDATEYKFYKESILGDD